MLELKGLTRRYGDLVALDDLSFTGAEGQMFGFVGPNSAGKTTAMRIVLGVLEPDAGQRVGSMPEDHGQTFSTQFARLEAQQQQTLCQFGQQTQHPPTDPPCRCGKARATHGKSRPRSRFGGGRWL
jgi:ABC-type branched-subunit amino acid transport system ATPase component